MASATLQHELPVAAPPPAGRGSTTVAVLALCLCCLFWGFSFPAAQKVTLMMESAVGQEQLTASAANALRPVFNGWRFAVAAIAYLLLTFPQQRRFTRRELTGGLVIGLFFCAAVFLQLFGLRYTAPSVSAFLTALAVVFAPIAQVVILRRPLSRQLWCSVAIAVLGMSLLSWPGSSSPALAAQPPFPLFGELLTIASALLFTGHILAVDRFGQETNASRITLLMLAVAAVISLAVGFATGGSVFFAGPVLATLASDVHFWWMFLVLALVAGAASLHLMNRYQPLLCPAIATVIYCLEPVFGTGFSLLLGTEELRWLMVAGGGLIVCSVLLIARRG